MRYVPDDVLTPDPILNRQTYFVIQALGKLGASQVDFVDLLRTLLHKDPQGIKKFCQQLRIFLPTLIEDLARSHPDDTPIEAPSRLRDDRAASIRKAIAGNATDLTLEKRGWDVDEAVAVIAGYYELLKEFSEIGVTSKEPTDWTITEHPENGELSIYLAVPELIAKTFIYEMRRFLDLIAQERNSLSKHADDVLI